MITIYSKPNCTFCEQAKSLCIAKGIEYKMLKLDVDYTKDELMEKCPVPVRSVPQIFADDQYVGGFTDLKAWVGDLKTDKA